MFGLGPVELLCIVAALVVIGFIIAALRASRK